MSMTDGVMLSVASNQWATRPADERFTSLERMYEARYDVELNCKESTIHSSELVADWVDHRLILQPKPDKNLSLSLEPTNWAMSQFSSWHKIPAQSLRLWDSDRKPDSYNGYQSERLISDVINHSLRWRGRDLVFYHDKYSQSYPQTLRAVTSESYERIPDHELIKKVMLFVAREKAQKGTNWKVPGTIDWSTGKHNSHIEVTKDNTTLYAGDRDSFIFLVDDENPIYVGKTQRGEDDILFRGFIIGNSVVGYKKVWGTSFLFRGVCMNRCIWGAQDILSFSMRHVTNVKERLFDQYINPNHGNHTQREFERRTFVDGLAYLSGKQKEKLLQAESSIKLANEADIYKDSDDAKKALVKLFPAKTADNILDHHLKVYGDGKTTDMPVKTLWHLHNTITEYAKTIPHQDSRYDFERKAASILPMAA